MAYYLRVADAAAAAEEGGGGFYLGAGFFFLAAVVVVVLRFVALVLLGFLEAAEEEAEGAALTFLFLVGEGEVAAVNFWLSCCSSRERGRRRTQQGQQRLSPWQRQRW